MDNKKNDILKDSEIKLYILCLGSIPNDFTANYMKKHDQMVTCTICPLNIILLKLVILSIFIKLWQKVMFGLLKKNIYWIIN